MPRFFIENNIADETDRIEIKGADARHIRDVLRMHPGERLTVCDGARADLMCSIEGFSGDRVILNVLSRCRNRTEPSFEATLYQGLPKGDKFDLIIQKCVELGISRIVPVACERSIVKIPATDAPRKVQRWMRIAQEAAKQCGRGHIPEVTQPIRFADAIAQVKVNFPAESAEGSSSDGLARHEGLAAFIPFEGERILSLRDFLESEGLSIPTAAAVICLLSSVLKAGFHQTRSRRQPLQAFGVSHSADAFFARKPPAWLSWP